MRASEPVISSHQPPRRDRSVADTGPAVVRVHTGHTPLAARPSRALSDAARLVRSLITPVICGGRAGVVADRGGGRPRSADGSVPVTVHGAPLTARVGYNGPARPATSAWVYARPDSRPVVDWGVLVLREDRLKSLYIYM